MSGAQFVHKGILAVFPNLQCLFSTFHLQYPLVLSRFCYKYYNGTVI